MITGSLTSFVQPAKKLIKLIQILICSFSSNKRDNLEWSMYIVHMVFHMSPNNYGWSVIQWSKCQLLASLVIIISMWSEKLGYQSSAKLVFYRPHLDKNKGLCHSGHSLKLATRGANLHQSGFRKYNLGQVCTSIDHLSNIWFTSDFDGPLQVLCKE